MLPTDAQDRWDFYPCRVDDAPASIFVNFWFTNHRPPAAIDTLYYADLQILDPGPHGMGKGEDAEQLHTLEDAIVATAMDQGFYFVGRLRNDGDWQLTFYALPHRHEVLEKLVVEHLTGLERGHRSGHKHDPDWSYFRDFLMPNAERWRWMLDRRVVEQLRAHGDDLDEEREVDHCIYFSTHLLLD